MERIDTISVNEKQKPEPLGKGKTSGFIVRHIREGILNGSYAPGQRLIEADLTSRLGVSRGPVREAFRQLAAEGLLENASNRGTMVREFNDEAIRELYEIRVSLEKLAAKLAAQNIDKDGNKLRLLEIMKMLEQDHNRYSPYDFFQENNDFHGVIAELSGNKQLASMIKKMQFPFVIYRWKTHLYHEVGVEAKEEHREIAQAIFKGNSVEAESKMDLHLRRGASLICDDEGPVTGI